MQEWTNSMHHNRSKNRTANLITDHLVALSATSLIPYMLVYCSVSGWWPSTVGLTATCWPCPEHHFFPCSFFLVSSPYPRATPLFIHELNNLCALSLIHELNKGEHRQKKKSFCKHHFLVLSLRNTAGRREGTVCSSTLIQETSSSCHLLTLVQLGFKFKEWRQQNEILINIAVKNEE